MTKKECDSAGNCYYIFNAWQSWGRWVLLGCLIFVLFALIPISGYLMSVYRMRQGLPPIVGCAWMFPNPYKHAQTSEDQRNLTQNEQRYRPHTELDSYREQKNLAFEREMSAGSLSEEYSYPSSNEKFEQP
ncbi:hypothetical protein DASB73_012230 [Starmerella bacillaris]|uniref:Uncharacterized protein n=1 Tax=Starmerella bacillaris TaxID=1247836 RepID=A0AAV5RFU7_STABA|nr:hypothetical protein DASB73_012230 [Starmerella bacillaris]